MEQQILTLIAFIQFVRKRFTSSLTLGPFLKLEKTWFEFYQNKRGEMKNLKKRLKLFNGNVAQPFVKKPISPDEPTVCLKVLRGGKETCAQNEIFFCKKTFDLFFRLFFHADGWETLTNDLKKMKIVKCESSLGHLISASALCMIVDSTKKDEEFNFHVLTYLFFGACLEYVEKVGKFDANNPHAQNIADMMGSLSTVIYPFPHAINNLKEFLNVHVKNLLDFCDRKQLMKSLNRAKNV